MNRSISALSTFSLPPFYRCIIHPFTKASIFLSVTCLYVLYNDTLWKVYSMNEKVLFSQATLTSSKKGKTS